MDAFLDAFWQDIAGWLFLLDIAVTAGTLLAVLHLKREPMSAIAWSLAVILMPLVGPLLFLVFGYQTVSRPIARRRTRKKAYRSITAGALAAATPGDGARPAAVPKRWEVLAKLGHHPDGYPVTAGNRVVLFHHGDPAYAAVLAAIDAATHHVHVEFFIFRGDDTGRRFVDALVAAARRGVEVRFLYDSVGSLGMSRRLLRELTDGGAKTAGFLPLLNPLYRFRVNLRNHRKIVVVDGRVAFTGGLNVGDEYLGRVAQYGYWRDTFLRLDGPAVESLQRVFLEDWHYATEEAVRGTAYYPEPEPHPGTSLVQIVHSGPDMDYKAIRETYFAGILRGRKRVWIASPYYVPDAGLRDALMLAGRAGVDVRYLGLFRPDHTLAFLAARYYWPELLAAGVKVYQYGRGVMHGKYMLVDGEWASVGTANFDNRSLLLNYEVNAMVYDPAVVAELEEHFLRDLAWAVRIDPDEFAKRPYAARVAENAARLLSPVL